MTSSEVQRFQTAIQPAALGCSAWERAHGTRPDGGAPLDETGYAAARANPGRLHSQASGRVPHRWTRANIPLSPDRSPLSAYIV